MPSLRLIAVRRRHWSRRCAEARRAGRGRNARVASHAGRDGHL